jgi:hypothetical protein
MLKIDHQQQFVEDCENVRDSDVLEFLFKRHFTIECHSSFVKSEHLINGKECHVYKLTCKPYYGVQKQALEPFEVFGSIDACEKGVMPSAGDILYPLADALTMSDNFYDWIEDMAGTVYFEGIKTVRGIQEKLNDLIKFHSTMHDIKLSFQRHVPNTVRDEIITLMEDY